MKHDRGDDVSRSDATPPSPEVDEPIQQVGDMTDEDEEPGVAAEIDQEALEASLRSIRPGEIVEGTVVEIRDNEVVVHVGGKYEGVIPVIEFPSPSEVPAPGQTVNVAVIAINEDEGQVTLSKKKADYENVWARILNALKTGETVTAMVTERVKGGLRVDLGVSGFVPASQVSTRNVRDLDRFVGRSLRLRIIEADRRQKKVILSHKQVVEEERGKRREETLSKLREGMVCEGKVRNITNYGAFVDLGGVDGLLHISEIAWTRVKHPSDVLNVGDTIQVAIIGIDRENNRISLSHRECMPDPWREAAKSLRPGQVVKARITRLARNGAFALIVGADIEGFIPISELSDRRISEPSEVVKVDDAVDLKVISLRPDERRMTLSLAEAEQEKERQEYREYMAGQSTARPTLGDQFGHILSEVQTAPTEGEEAAAPPAEAGPVPETPPAAEPPATSEEAAAQPSEAEPVPETPPAAEPPATSEQAADVPAAGEE
jgi:small subunit ribosomal protein S1/4-hydroxy-3-methylbut-2-en-1-yl diphosphate reductase